MTEKKTEEKPRLVAEKRKITGRKVKALRQKGILPANIFGKKIKSSSIQVDLKSFLSIFKKAGETGLVEISISGEKEKRPALIHNLQKDPISDQPLHVDFYQVDLKEKIISKVPIVLAGDSPAVVQKIGILIQPLYEVEVEALPADLPDKFEIDISNLKQVADSIFVESLKTPPGVKIVSSPKEVLAKIQPLGKEEVVAPPPTPEAVPTEAAPAEGVPPATEAKAEGKEAEKPASGKPPVGKQPVGKPPEAKVEKQEKAK